jgi:hypothetical protein
MTEIILPILLLVYIVWKEYLYHQTIKDLTAKIKAKDVYEYKEFEKPVEKETKTLQEEIIPPEEAEPEEYLKALKKELEKTEVIEGARKP